MDESTDKAGIKREIAELKKKISEAIEEKRSGDLRKLRRTVRHLKATTRRLGRKKTGAEPAPAAGGDSAPPAA